MAEDQLGPATDRPPVLSGSLSSRSFRPDMFLVPWDSSRATAGFWTHMLAANRVPAQMRVLSLFLASNDHSDINSMFGHPQLFKIWTTV